MQTLTLSFIIFLLTSISVKGQEKFVFSKADGQLIVEKANEIGFSGTIFIYQDKQQVYYHRSGYANVDDQIQNDSSIRYNIGSIGKSITAILMMQLVEQGKIKLNENANQYLPKAFQLNHPSGVTVRQLLNMTSGLGDYFDSPDYSDTINSVDGLMKLVLAAKPANDTPGIRINYSNSSFIVLGKILEHHYQKSYQQIVVEKILRPAGILFDQSKIHAVGYSQENDKWIVGKDNMHGNWSAAGGLYLTVTELHAVIKTLINGGYINQQTLNSMWNKEVHPEMDPPFVYYGLGWMVEEPGNVKLRGHNGGVRGFQSVFRYIPDDNLYIYILSNHENGAENLFMQTLMHYLNRKGIQLQ